MEQHQIIERINEVLRRYDAPGSDAATGDVATDADARAWINAGFDDPEEVEAWLVARCFTADGARELDRAGITSEQAAIRTRAGITDDEDTIGYKLVTDQLGFDEARRIITSHFWNS